MPQHRDLRTVRPLPAPHVSRPRLNFWSSWVYNGRSTRDCEGPLELVVSRPLSYLDICIFNDITPSNRDIQTTHQRPAHVPSNIKIPYTARTSFPTAIIPLRHVARTISPPPHLSISCQYGASILNSRTAVPLGRTPDSCSVFRELTYTAGHASLESSQGRPWPRCSHTDARAIGMQRDTED